MPEARNKCAAKFLSFITAPTITKKLKVLGQLFHSLIPVNTFITAASFCNLKSMLLYALNQRSAQKFVKLFTVSEHGLRLLATRSIHSMGTICKIKNLSGNQQKK